MTIALGLGILWGFKTVKWLSGRKRTPGKCVYVNSVSRVRIPPSPPLFLSLLSYLFCVYLRSLNPFVTVSPSYNGKIVSNHIQCLGLTAL